MNDTPVEQTPTPIEPPAQLDTPCLQCDEHKEKYLRALAEIENTRKRLTREKIESQSFVMQSIIADLLQPIDHLEQALHHASSATAEISAWAKGFDMLVKQLRQVIADHGAVAFDSIGMVFDPNRHEAIETEVSLSEPEGRITHEFQKGYMLAGRVIRPAKVRVVTKPKHDEPSTINQQGE